MRVFASRGLAREALDFGSVQVFLRYVHVDCHFPLPGVIADFGFFEVFWGSSSGGRFLV